MKPLEKFRKEQLGAVRVCMMAYCLSFQHNRILLPSVILMVSVMFTIAVKNNSTLLFFKAERKKYEKETEKYYSSLEKLLNMSAKKKEPHLQEVSSPLPELWHICDNADFSEMLCLDCESTLGFYLSTVRGRALLQKPLDCIHSHRRASQQQFSRLVWKGSACSFAPRLRAAARGSIPAALPRDWHFPSLRIYRVFPCLFRDEGL